MAEVALVDAVELVCGCEAHGLHDFIGCCTAFEPPLCLFHSRVFNRLADCLSADLREAKFRELARAAEMSCNICRSDFDCSVRGDELLRHVDEPCRRY